jgi:hypothetical protein
LSPPVKVGRLGSETTCQYASPSVTGSSIGATCHALPYLTPSLLKRPRQSCCKAPHLTQDCDMGNLCGKPAKDDDNFSAPGRPVNSTAPPPKAAAAAPIAKPAKAQIANRTLGGTNGSAEGPRAAAARAAEVCTQVLSARRRSQCDDDHYTTKLTQVTGTSCEDTNGTQRRPRCKVRSPETTDTGEHAGRCK